VSVCALILKESHALISVECLFSIDPSAHSFTQKVSHAPTSVECLFSLTLLHICHPEDESCSHIGRVLVLIDPPAHSFTQKVRHAPISIECLFSIDPFAHTFTRKVSHAPTSIQCLFSMTFLPKCWHVISTWRVDVYLELIDPTCSH
jgi:hypothetical protein